MSFAFDTLPHHWINRLSFLIRRDLQDRFQAAGYKITPEEWAVLLFLWQRDGRTPGALAALTVRDATTMTRLLDKMVKKHLITREADAKDRRKSRICLTQLGGDLRAPLVDLAKGLIGESLEGVGHSDMQATLRVMQQMTDNLTKKEG
jgi:DNA-binding MarR family transcriptional regulator